MSGLSVIAAVRLAALHAMFDGAAELLTDEAKPAPVDELKALLRNMQQMFRGTFTQAADYPREVVKECLALKAAAEPSRADECLMQTLKSALQFVDVRVLDHLVVTTGDVVSFAERGLL